MSFRRATADDAAALCEAMVDFNAIEGIPWDPAAGRAALDTLLANAALGFITVAYDGAALAAYCVITYGYDLEFRGRDAWVTEVWVAPDRRGSGLGKQLLAAALAAARADHVLAIHLQVRPENDRARRLYEGLGFTTSKRLILTRKL
jgi:ribosomal protein S18 acetylase RimI-like enzyme